VAAAAGPFLGGYLIAAASWRFIFLINVPLGVVVLVLSIRHVPESHDPTASRHIDVLGALLATVALAGVTYGLIEGPEQGWAKPAVTTMLAVGIVAAVAFILAERASPAPMLPLSVFRLRQFTVTNGVTFIVYAALGGALFLLPVQLQVADGYSPLESGVALLPLTLIMLALSARSGKLATRIGPRLQMSVGPVVVGVGLALLARVTTDSDYLSGVLPAVVVFGLGLAITVAPLTATALAAVPSEHSGLASAVNNDVARIGSLIAVAVLPALAGISGDSYLHPAEFSKGFRTATLVAAALCLAGGVLAAIGIRNPTGVPSKPQAPPEAQATTEPKEAGCYYCALEATPIGTRHSAPPGAAS
jgi:EmrB/QacA subfamily drug resistance transporter